MTYRANPVLEKLDHAAEATGFPAFSRRVQQAIPVPFRIAPAVLVVIAAVALFERAWWSMSVIMLVWTGSLCLHAFGPLRMPSSGRRLDERERQLIRDGHFTGMAVTLGLAIIGCLVFAFGSVVALFQRSWFWVPSGPVDWIMLALSLMILEANIALLAASWALPRKLPRDEDDG